MDMFPVPQRDCLENVRSGQRLIVAAMVIQVCLLFLASPDARLEIDLPTALLGWCGVIVTMMSIVAVIRVNVGLGHGIVFSGIMGFLTIFPVLGLLLMVVFYLRARAMLQENGFAVGLFGAARKTDAANFSS